MNTAEREQKPELHVVSFSGGKDSTAMLCGMKERGMKIDMILYCDTGIEFPAMYEHIKKVEQYIGVPITRLKSEKSFEYLLLEHKINVRNKENYNNKGYSFPGIGYRWCTSELKTKVINRYIKNLKRSYNIVQYIGIAADEENRVKDLNYPLIEWGWTESDCLKYCYEKGFDFGGLYEIFHRVSCWCCPLQSLEELRQLRKHFPDLWQQLQEWQLKTWRKFRADFSVQELEIRFQFEEERTAKGLSTSGRNKEFRAKLKRRLNK